MGDAKRKLATSDSGRYARSFYGILNADGAFCTPLAFASEGDAEQWRDAFWKGDLETPARVRRTHKVVPVRIRLNQLEPNPTTKGSA